MTIKLRTIAPLLALSGLAALPACSMFGGDSGSSRASRSSSSYAAAPSHVPPAPPMAQSTELTPDMMRNVQQTLQQAGMYRGRIDGVWGTGTQAAVRSYQQQHNLNATGQLDQDTLSAMNLASAQNNAQLPSNQRYGSNYNPDNTPPPNNSPQYDNPTQPGPNPR